MKTKKMILPAICFIPLLSSCASYQTAGNEAFRIKPVFSVKSATDSADSLYQVGRYFQGQQRYEQAAVAYRRALAADSGFVEARNGLGVIYSMQGQYDKAIVELNMAVSQAPKAAHLYNNLGHALYLHGEYAESVAVLEKAAALDPKNQNTLNNLGLAYAKAGDTNKSNQNFIAATSPAQQEEAKVPALSGQPIVSQPASSEPAHIAAQAQAAAIQPAPVQTLALPKDRGVISRAPGILVANTENHLVTVQLAPNVYELRERAKLPTNIIAKAQPIVAIPQLIVAVSKPVTIAAQPVAVAPKPAIIASQSVAAVPKPVVVASQPVAAVPKTIAAAAQPTLTPAELARFRIEVSNGNGTTGMAMKVATFLRGTGYASARLTNQKPFTVQASQIQYKNGHQKDAEKMRSNLPGYTEIVQNDSLRADINVRVVLGKDIVSHTAYFDGKPQKLRFARNGLDS